MKIETLLLIAAAGVAGYVIATKKTSPRVGTAPVPPSALPTTTPNVVIEEYDIYDYGPWGYPGYGGRVWGGSWGGGGRHGGGGHGGGHHGGHH